METFKSMLAGERGTILFGISYGLPMGEKLFHLSCRRANLFGADGVSLALLWGKNRNRTVEGSFPAHQIGQWYFFGLVGVVGPCLANYSTK